MMNKNWIAFKTIARKEIQRFLRIWGQTLLPSVITQSLYFIIFGSFIGSQLQDIKGVSYMAFIVPGLIMMVIINSSFQNVVSSFFGAKFQRSIEELIISSTPNYVIIAGFVVGGVLRGLLVGLLVFIISLLFVQIEVFNPWLVLLFATLTAVLFSLNGLLISIFAKKFDDMAIFPTFILVPLTYLGGVFYSIERLPEFWQNISKLNPILYMVDAFRYGFLGFSDINIVQSTLIILSFILVFTFVCNYLLEKGVGMKA